MKMDWNRKIVFCVSAIVLYAGSSLLLAAEESSWAKISHLSGDVQVRSGEKAKWEAAKPDQIVRPGSQLKTSSQSSVNLQTKEKHRVHLSPKTTILVEETSSEKTIFKVLLGRLRSYVRPLKKNQQFRIKSPVAVASVRGTEFDTIVEENDKTTFEVTEGVVNVSDLENIGAEVTLFKNQRTSIMRGHAPLPPENLKGDKGDQRGDLRQNQDVQKVKEMARFEARREMGLQQFKEHLQADVSREQRMAQYQDGKTVIDAFGMRVRMEEYIVRPEPKQFSFVTINTRLDNVSYSRYDAWALADLPAKIVDINPLFQQHGTANNKPINYIVQQKWFISNGGDIYREWSEAGDMIFFNTLNLWQVVYDHWYVELKGRDAANFRLVSHWVPSSGYKSGTVPTIPSTYYSNGALDTPLGYDNFVMIGNSGFIGDNRPIDAVAFGTRLLNSNIFGSSIYQHSEGYARSSYAELDGVRFSDIPNALKLSALLNAKKVSAVHTYLAPTGNSTVTTLRVDQYNIDDNGARLSLSDRAARNLSPDSINFESVASSPDFSSKIDLVVSPRIFRQAGLIE